MEHNCHAVIPEKNVFAALDLTKSPANHFTMHPTDVKWFSNIVDVKYFLFHLKLHETKVEMYF